MNLIKRFGKYAFHQTVIMYNNIKHFHLNNEMARYGSALLHKVFLVNYEVKVATLNTWFNSCNQNP